MTDQTAIQTTMISHMRLHWKALAFRGGLMVVAGIAAVALPYAATLATDLLVGWLFVFAGFARGVALLSGHHTPGFFLSLLADLVMLALGIVLIVQPQGGELTLALLVAGFFIIEAVVEFFVAFNMRGHSGRSVWMVLSGLASLVIAAFIYSGWPGTATWMVGLLIGVNLIFRGMATIGTALALRNGATAVL